jgi:hypothetical protein
MEVTGLICLAVSLPNTIMEPFRPVYFGHAKPAGSTGAVDELATKEIHSANDVSHLTSV